MFAAFLRRIKPFKAASTEVVRPNETLAGFVWRASGAHQFYVGLIAIAVALLNFAPIDLQRRVVDEAIVNRDVKLLLFLGAFYLAIVVIQGALKYALLFYQGWVGESAVRAARDQLAVVASKRRSRDDATSGQTVNVIGREIDNVGGFVGTSISEFVINLTLLTAIAGYMLYDRGMGRKRASRLSFSEQLSFLFAHDLVGKVHALGFRLRLAHLDMRPALDRLHHAGEV